MSDDLVKRARDVLNGATPGPWYIGAQNDALYVIDGPPSPSPYDGPIPKSYGPNVVCTPAWRDMPTEKNAHFIAASRELVPAMADRIEELEAKLAKAVAALDKLSRLGNGEKSGNSNGNMIALTVLVEINESGDD